MKNDFSFVIDALRNSSKPKKHHERQTELGYKKELRVISDLID